MKRTKTIVVVLDYTDIWGGPLILVNRHHPVRGDVPEKGLTEIAPGVRVEKQPALLYGEAIKATGAASEIIPVSGYRSQSEQARLFADSVAAHGETYTRTYVALPGCSEHQTGLAIDVAKKAPNIDSITPAFPYTGICQQFRKAAGAHGFIQRYPEGKEQITGIGHEPWHFRYVGIPHSELITEKSFTLEEYVDWIKGFPWATDPYCFPSGGRMFEVGYVQAHKAATEIALRGEPYTISGNNVDGFIVAAWGCAV